MLTAMLGLSPSWSAVLIMVIGVFWLVALPVLIGTGMKRLGRYDGVYSSVARHPRTWPHVVSFPRSVGKEQPGSDIPAREHPSSRIGGHHVGAASG